MPVPCRSVCMGVVAFRAARGARAKGNDISGTHHINSIFVCAGELHLCVQMSLWYLVRFCIGLKRCVQVSSSCMRR